MPDCVAVAAEHLVNVQIDDMRRGVHEHLEFGAGEIDFPPVLRALADGGYRGLVAVELPRHSHAAPDVAARSLAFLRAAEQREAGAGRGDDPRRPAQPRWRRCRDVTGCAMPRPASAPTRGRVFAQAGSAGCGREPLPAAPGWTAGRGGPGAAAGRAATTSRPDRAALPARRRRRAAGGAAGAAAAADRRRGCPAAARRPAHQRHPARRGGARPVRRPTSTPRPGGRASSSASSWASRWPSSTTSTDRADAELAAMLAALADGARCRRPGHAGRRAAAADLRHRDEGGS